MSGLTKGPKGEDREQEQIFPEMLDLQVLHCGGK
jgi:hypothetical protein